MMDKALAVGHIPSGLFIVCSEDGGVIDGYLASWVQQISFSPLLICLAIKPGRPAYEFIKSGKVFSINVIGDHEKNYMKHFWKGYDPNSNPFGELQMAKAEHGAPILLQAKSSIECRLVSVSKPGDHEVVVAEVLSSVVHHQESKPLTHVRKSGLEY